MARIRSVHPEQWTDDQFVTSSPLARLLAIGVRNHADDNGVFVWNPVKLKMLILPADPVDRAGFEALLQELIDTNQLQRFEVDGKAYGLIRSFRKFQKPKKPMYYHPLPAELVPYAMGTSSEPVLHQSGKVRSDGEKSREEKKESTTLTGPQADAVGDYPTEFEATFGAYPKRLGDNPKRKAFHAWNARRKEGYATEAIHAGVERYAAFVRATGKENTDKVKHASTFFGPDKAFLEPWHVGNGRGKPDPFAELRNEVCGPTERDITHETERL